MHVLKLTSESYFPLGYTLIVKPVNFVGDCQDGLLVNRKKMGEKRTRSKTPVIYRIVVRGETPGNIRERLSEIHARAILKAYNRVTSNVDQKAPGYLH